MVTEPEVRVCRPDKEAVFYRACCLAAMFYRGLFEHHYADRKKYADCERQLDVLRGWMADHGVMRHFSPCEEAAIVKSPGDWSQREIMDASWRLESLGVLGWALTLVRAMPGYDTQFSPASLRHMLVGADLRMPVKRAVLRPSIEIDRQRDIAEMWHWRSRTTQCIEMGVQPPEGLTFEEIIANSAREHHRRRDIPRVIRDDFPVHGKPYSSLSRDEYSRVTSIAAERHYALNWLCGFSEAWDETRTDT